MYVEREAMSSDACETDAVFGPGSRASERSRACTLQATHEQAEQGQVRRESYC